MICSACFFLIKMKKGIDLEFTPDLIIIQIERRDRERQVYGNMTIREVSEKYEITQDTLRYYERMGMIPPVTRNASGIRDYTEEDLAWVGLAKCMRAAGLPVEAMAEYVRLTQQGDSTIRDRLQLLQEQREELLKKREQIDVMLNRLEQKIERYETAVETGVLDWSYRKK